MEIINCLHDAFDHVESRKPEDILECLKKVPVTMENVAPFIEEPQDTPYGRTLLMRNEAVEAFLMHWPPGSMSFPHDHGSSFGVGVVITGYLREIQYNLDESGFPQANSVAEAPAGSYFFVPEGQIHALENSTSEQLLTLHVYSPPIQGMKTYDEADQILRVVSDDCGAWRPLRTNQIIREEKIG